MNIKKILTHVNPDLDAMLSVFLVKKYGENKFPGAGNAEVIFSNANQLPENKSTKQLEKEGVLALDIGGGRFDTHPVNNKLDVIKKDRCATDIIAEYLGLSDTPELKLLIEYTRLQDTRGHSLSSKDYIHHLGSIHTILLGFNLLKLDSLTLINNGTDILDNLIYYQKFKNYENDGNELLKKCLWHFLTEYSKKINLIQEKYNNINEWINRINNDFQNAFSSIEMDEAVSLRAIVVGANIKYYGRFENVYSVFKMCLDAIIKREEEWYNAKIEFEKNAIIKNIKPLCIVGIISENQMIIKVARSSVRSDILVYRNPRDGATTVFLHKNGPLNKYRLNKLAGLIRVIESYLNNEIPDYRNIENVGVVNGWFLHQSEILLIKGSPKAQNFIPSKISVPELVELICFFLDRKKENVYHIPLLYYKLLLEYENPVFRK